MIKGVSWPKDDNKYYLFQKLVTGFIEADNFNKLIDIIINRYKREKLFDFDGFKMCKGSQPPKKCKWFNWKDELTENQWNEIQKLDDLNYKLCKKLLKAN